MSETATGRSLDPLSLRSAPDRARKKCSNFRAFMHARFFWIGLPARAIEHFFCVEHLGVWREHLMWSKRNGEELRNTLTQRFASSTVVLSLLLSTELGVLFSPSDPAKEMRIELSHGDHDALGFYAGVVLCMSIFLTVSALVASFTAWSVVSAISKENVHSVLRSTLGLYAAQLPSNLIILAIYFFFLWIVLFWYILMPLTWAITLNVSGIITICHVVSTYSALGRVVIHSGAMGEEYVLSVRDQEFQTPEQLFDSLKQKTAAAKKANIPVHQQYRMPYQLSLANIVTTPDSPNEAPSESDNNSDSSNQHSE